MSSIAPATPKPALQIITSSRPNRSTAAATKRSMASTDLTSATIGSACPPAASTSRAAAASMSDRRAHIATDARSRATRTAVARPMPADAPVIATTRPFCIGWRIALGMDRSIRLLRELVAINSINPTLVPGAPGEQAIADAIANEMRRIGLDVSLETVAPGRPNVVGVLDGRSKGRAMILCGHTDTVGVVGMSDPFNPVERDGRLYGRGTQDMKAGVAAMIDAARVVRERGFEKGRLIIAAVVDEEHSSIGADALVRRWTADGAIVTEPTDLAIAVAHK